MAEGTIAILGAKGMLGTDVTELCVGHRLHIKALDLPEFDITDSEQLKEAVDDSDIIVNCAAYTDVDSAESEYELAYKVNAEAVGRLGAIAEQAGKYVMHISTDFVFDGRSNRPYIETDPPNPINAYGKSKLAGEQLLIESGCANCIIRIEWTYGRAGNNFVKKVLTKAKTKDELKIVDDQTGSPTATTEVARIICRLLGERPEGLFHFASAGYVSRFDMARFILDKTGTDVKVRACKSGDFSAPAKRPLNSRFNCDKIQALLDKPIEQWEAPLERFLKTVEF